MKADSRDDEDRSRKMIGLKLAALFRKTEVLEVDGFRVDRMEEERHREGGLYRAKTYGFSRTTAQPAQPIGSL